MALYKSNIEAFHLTFPDEVFQQDMAKESTVTKTLKAYPRYIIYLYSKSSNSSPIGQIISVIVDTSDPYCFEAYYSAAGQYVNRHDRSKNLFLNWTSNSLQIANLSAYPVRAQVMVYY